MLPHTQAPRQECFLKCYSRSAFAVSKRAQCHRRSSKTASLSVTVAEQQSARRSTTGGSTALFAAPASPVAPAVPDKEHENGTHYSLYEVVSILQGKEKPYAIVQYWLKTNMFRCCHIRTVMRAVDHFKNTGIMPTKGFQSDRISAADDEGSASLPSPQKPKAVILDDNSPEPPPANGTHYSLYEMVSILKGKRFRSRAVTRWKDEGLCLCSPSSIYRLFKKFKDTGIMPAKDDYGCKPGRPSVFLALPSSEAVAALVSAKSTTSSSAPAVKPTVPAPAPKPPPKLFDITTLPLPINGTHYSQYEAVTILIGISEKAAKTSIAKQWIEHNLIHISRTALIGSCENTGRPAKFLPKVIMVVYQGGRVSRRKEG